MNIKHRRRLLAMAKLLNRWAMRIRAYVKRNTPKRK
jgi:hypothetical protein